MRYIILCAHKYLILNAQRAVQQGDSFDDLLRGLQIASLTQKCMFQWSWKLKVPISHNKGTIERPHESLLQSTIVCNVFVINGNLHQNKDRHNTTWDDRNHITAIQIIAPSTSHTRPNQTHMISLTSSCGYAWLMYINCYRYWINNKATLGTKSSLKTPIYSRRTWPVGQRVWSCLENKSSWLALALILFWYVIHIKLRIINRTRVF